MGRVVIHPSPGVARLLQARREEMGLSLREASARTAACGPTIPFQTLAKIETGKTDPGLRRLHCLMRLYGLPLEVVDDLAELDELADFRRVGDDEDPRRLLETGRRAWQVDDVATSLACAIAGRERFDPQIDDRSLAHELMILQSTLAQRLGKDQLVRHLTTTMLREGPEPALAFEAFTLAAAAFAHLGSVGAARAFLARAEAIRPEDRPAPYRTRVMCHEQGGDLQLALEAARRWFDDPLVDARDRARARHHVGRLAYRVGRPREALAILREVAADARSLGWGVWESVSRVYESLALVELGEIDEASSVASRTRNALDPQSEPELVMLVHYAAWRVAVASQDDSAARQALAAAYAAAIQASRSTPAQREIVKAAHADAKRTLTHGAV